MRKFEVVTGFENVKLPKRATKGSAGYDFYVLEEAIIPPHQAHIFSTGVKACMNPDEVLMLFVRSSLGIKKHLVLANGTGVVDFDYFNNSDNEGHIMIALHNTSNMPQQVDAGERVAQGIFQKYLITDDDDAEAERDGGIGSTGNV